MKFKFDCSIVVEAVDIETALGAITSHISTVNRQVASGLEDCAPEFSISRTSNDAVAVDLTDRLSQANGAIALELDPKSPAGIAYAAQLKARADAGEKLAGEAPREPRTDAEILAEHSAREQAELAQP